MCILSAVLQACWSSSMALSLSLDAPKLTPAGPKTSASKPPPSATLREWCHLNSPLRCGARGSRGRSTYHLRRSSTEPKAPRLLAAGASKMHSNDPPNCARKLQAAGIVRSDRSRSFSPLQSSSPSSPLEVFVPLLVHPEPARLHRRKTVNTTGKQQDEEQNASTLSLSFISAHRLSVFPV